MGAAGSRRGAAIGSGVALVVMLAVASLAGLALPAAGQEHHGVLPEGDWTDEQMALAEDMVMRTEAALQEFSDIPTIQALGFEDFGITAPGGYDHWINWDWIDDGHLLDPERPESLVFQHTGSGDPVLVAAMFLADSDHDMSNLPADIAWWPGWHTHENVCVDENRRFAGLAGPDGECFSGRPFDRPPMMHVWIVDNACGHRFGEIDVGGLICDVDHGHGPGPGPEPHEPNEPHDPHDPHEPRPGGDDPGHDMPPMAPPAQPVPGEPNFTG